MRITNGMIINNFVANMQVSTEKVDKYMTWLGTGKKINRLSDDSIGVLNALTARGRLARFDQYLRNLNSAQNWVDQCDTSLNELSGLMTDVRDQVINAATTIKTDTDRQNIVSLVKELKQTMMEALNASVGKQYIFAGYNTTNSPFTQAPDTLGVDSKGNDIPNPNAGVVLYNGLPLSEPKEPVAPTVPPFYQDPVDGDPAADAEYDLQLEIYNVQKADYDSMKAQFDSTALYEQEINQQLKMEVGFGYSMDVAINGLQIVGVGKESLFAQLDEIIKLMEAPGISTDDAVSQLSSKLGAWDRGHTRITTALARVGAMETRIDMLNNRYEDDIVNYNELRSKIEDVDTAEAAVYWQMAQYVYQQTLAVGAKIVQPTLMDFLN